MPGSSNTSFIPKHTPNKAERKSSPRQLFLGTLLVRILFFAVLIAAAVTFVYERRLSSQLDEEMVKFTTAASTYDADAEKLGVVVAMDNRLRQAREVFTENVSTIAIFEALEEATAESVQLTTLSLTREKEDEILLAATVKTDTFDSTLFQRSTFTSSDVLARTEIKDVTIEGASREGEVVGETAITFKASMAISTEDIPALIIQESSTFVPVDTTPATAPGLPATNTEAVQVEVGFSNEEAS